MQFKTLQQFSKLFRTEISKVKEVRLKRERMHETHVEAMRKRLFSGVVVCKTVNPD